MKDGDLVVKDGITWLCIEALGLKVLANLDELNRDPMEQFGPIKVSFSDEPRSPRLSSTPFFCVDSRKG